ncbi:RNase RNM [Acerihabitans arboris]|uniref:PHP domain-containing protein n=1 Tax=Acerihabitans arboris TaxID=2691583 RepID=A0A845SIG9_9GAMM|nr:PHP domain-containing protein [Acerihabitans arboris]NDL62421.1 PHP domain-containing protein [Acerihabitans arboris]
MTEISVKSSLLTLYDLHSHTTASDGLLSPAELVARAVAMGVDVLAVTDHDTISGLAEARRAVSDGALPLTLVAGVEVSTQWANHEIHIVGLGIDDAHSAMDALLAAQREKRLARARAIAERLERAGINDAWTGANRFARDELVTRGHFARYLVGIGAADNVAKVFKKYLSKGKTGYVPPQWCTIDEAVDAIHQAGGQAVLAHPGRYQLSAKWLKRLMDHFAGVGGDGIEVAMCQQSPQEKTMLAGYARERGLLASQGSDFHQPCGWIELGRKLWLPGGVEPIWRDWPVNRPAVARELSEG